MLDHKKHLKLLLMVFTEVLIQFWAAYMCLSWNRTQFNIPSKFRNCCSCLEVEDLWSSRSSSHGLRLVGPQAKAKAVPKLWCTAWLGMASRDFGLTA
jgi:hypothetical protein